MQPGPLWDEQASAGQPQERCGVVDNRAVQALQPVLALNELHKKLAISSIKQQQADNPQLYSSFNTKLGEAAKQSTLTAGITASDAIKPDVPEGLTSETWAALQKTAKELDVRGIFDPQVNQLRSKMLQQAATPTAAQQSAATTLAGRLEASCQQVIASLPVKHAKSPHTAASVMSGVSAFTHRTNRTMRTVRLCPTDRPTTQQQLPQRSVEALEAAAESCSQHQQAQHPPTLQLNKSRRQTAVAVAVPVVDDIGASGSPTESPASPLAAAALAGLSARTSSTAEAVVAWQLQNEQLARSSSGQSSCRCVCSTTQQQQLHVGHVAGCPCATESTRSATASTAGMAYRSSRRQPTAIEAIAEESLHEGSRGTTGMHHSRTRQRKQDKSLADCVAAIALEDRPSSPPDQAPDSAAAVIQRRMSPAACEAFQTAVAAAVDSKLKLYRDTAQQARQEMLQRELANCPILQQQQQQQQEHGSNTTRTAGAQDAATHAYQGSNPAAAAADSQTAASVPCASTAADAALLTMQQLVALLAKRDATPEVPETVEQKAASSSGAIGQQQQEQPVLTKTAAASQKLATARTVAEIIAAANEHIVAAAHELDEPLRLDLRKVARMRQMGKAWHKHVARSSGSNPTSSRSTTSTAPGTARSKQPTTDSSRCEQAHTPRNMTPPPQPLPRSSTDTAAVSSTTAAAGSACTGDTAAANKRVSSAGVAGARVSTVGDPVSRNPAGMRLPPPRLQAPSEQELSALPLPSLPELLDLSHEPAKVLQARLERVWGVLGVPPEQQMEMVLSYTSRATATQFEVALDTWETAAAAVLQREGILQQLMQLRAAMQTQQQRRTNPDSRRVSQDVVSVMLGGLDINQIHQLLWAFLAATEQVKLIAQRLQDVTGQPLLMKSVPYPPVGAVMAASHLQPIMDEAWGLLGCDWV